MGRLRPGRFWAMQKGRLSATLLISQSLNFTTLSYRVDSISKPQASRRGSGMYFEFLFRRAHSRSRVDRKYWSGESLYSCTTCSNSVIVGVTGPMGSGLPQLGFPRRFAMKSVPSIENNNLLPIYFDSTEGPRDSSASKEKVTRPSEPLGQYGSD